MCAECSHDSVDLTTSQAVEIPCYTGRMPMRTFKTPRTAQIWRNNALRDKLDTLLGSDSSAALEAVKAIADGTAAKLPNAQEIALLENLPPQLKRAYILAMTPPTWEARLQAWALLLAYHQGKPTQSVEITAEVSNTAPTVDYSRLSDDEIKQLHHILTKAQTGSDTVIEGTARTYTDKELTGGDEDA